MHKYLQTVEREVDALQWRGDNIEEFVLEVEDLGYDADIEEEDDVLIISIRLIIAFNRAKMIMNRYDWLVVPRYEPICILKDEEFKARKLR